MHLRSGYDLGAIISSLVQDRHFDVPKYDYRKEPDITVNPGVADSLPGKYNEITKKRRNTTKLSGYDLDDALSLASIDSTDDKIEGETGFDILWDSSDHENRIGFL